jgi:hypothetical protein
MTAERDQKMAERAYGALVRRQTRHAEILAEVTGKPAETLAEEVRYLRSLLAKITHGNYAQSTDAATEVAKCSAALTGLMMSGLMEQEAPR